MNARPAYVAVIGWALIVVGGLSILSVLLVLGFPGLVAGPATGGATIALNLAASVLELVCGLFVLRGENWARFLYLLLSIASAAYLFTAASVDPTILIVWTLFVVVTLAGLFTPAAGLFFSAGAEEPEDAEIA